MKRHSDENDQEKVNLIKEHQLKKEQHDLDTKRLPASTDQQRQFQQQHCAITNQFVYFIYFCACFDKSHDQRCLSVINVAPHFSCAEEPALRYFL